MERLDLTMDFEWYRREKSGLWHGVGTLRTAAGWSRRVRFGVSAERGVAVCGVSEERDVLGPHLVTINGEPVAAFVVAVQYEIPGLECENQRIC